MKHVSPLRYPGGKSFLFNFMCKLIENNNLKGGDYSEPYAGGAGLAFKLLFSGHVSRIRINDLNRSIFTFWKVAVKNPNYLIDFIETCPISIDFYRNQKEVLQNLRCFSKNEIAAATLYLNRVNRSGILSGGPIGGYEQNGVWKLDARFNRITLIERLENIKKYSKQIDISDFDAITFIKKTLKKNAFNNKHFFYLDPPYFLKSKDLYLNPYKDRDHKKLCEYLTTIQQEKWLLSYDEHPFLRKLYNQFSIHDVAVSHSAGLHHLGQEIFIPSSKIEFNIYDLANINHNHVQASTSDYLTPRHQNH